MGNIRLIGMWSIITLIDLTDDILFLITWSPLLLNVILLAHVPMAAHRLTTSTPQKCTMQRSPPQRPSSIGSRTYPLSCVARLSSWPWRLRRLPGSWLSPGPSIETTCLMIKTHACRLYCTHFTNPALRFNAAIVPTSLLHPPHPSSDQFRSTFPTQHGNQAKAAS